MNTLVLLAGVPGAGKSTYAKTFFYPKYAVISSDVIRKRLAGTLREAHQGDLKPWDVFYGDITLALHHGVDVVADATFLTRKHRALAREVADKAKADVHLILFKNWFEAERRNEARDEEHQVPPDAMNGMMRLYWDTLADIRQEHYATVTLIEAFA